MYLKYRLVGLLLVSEAQNLLLFWCYNLHVHVMNKFLCLVLTFLYINMAFGNCLSGRGIQ